MKSYTNREILEELCSGKPDVNRLKKMLIYLENQRHEAQQCGYLKEVKTYGALIHVVKEALEKLLPYW